MTHRTFHFAWLCSVCILTAEITSCGIAAPKSNAAALSTAIAHFNVATSMHMVFSSPPGEGPPANVIAATTGNGSYLAPDSFSGTFTVSDNGLPINIGVIIFKGTSYLESPFTSTYTKTSLASYNFPDPTSFFNRAEGIPNVLSQTTNLKYTGLTEDHGTTLWTISGDIRDRAVSSLLGTPPSHRPISVIYGIVPSSGQLRSITMTGAFFTAGSQTTFNIELTNYNAPITINSPS